MSGLVELLHGTATAVHIADMPADPFEASELLEGVEHLAAELTVFAARIRAERVANARAWAVWERGELDKGTKPPPPPSDEPKPDKPADPDPKPADPPADPGEGQ